MFNVATSRHCSAYPLQLTLAFQLPRQGLPRKNIPSYRQLAKVATSQRVVFSGIQPTGTPHLGNYLGALRQWVQIQNDASPTTDVLFSIVDLHAMTMPYEQLQLRQWKRQTLAALLAVGVDPERSTVFFQSAV